MLKSSCYTGDTTTIVLGCNIIVLPLLMSICIYPMIIYVLGVTRIEWLDGSTRV